MKGETRAYPTCCTSAYCGRLACDDCPNLSILADFQAWREKHAAVQKGPVWRPSVWTATRKKTLTALTPGLGCWT